jgi:hypothetical protein
MRLFATSCGLLIFVPTMRLFAVLLASALYAPSYALSVNDAKQIQSVVGTSTGFRLGCLCDSSASVKCQYKNAGSAAWVMFGSDAAKAKAAYDADACVWSCPDWGTVSAAS